MRHVLFIAVIALLTQGCVGELETNGGSQTPPPNSPSTPSSNPTPNPASIAPANTVLPEISGTVAVGETLTGTEGTWTGDPAPTFSDEWQRCDTAGANCTAISGATQTTYVISSADIGATLRLKVTASNSAGTDDAMSLATDVVPSVTGSFTTSLTPGMTMTLPYTWTFDPGESAVKGYFWADGVLLGTVDGPGPYTFTITSAMLTAGGHTLGHAWDTTSGAHKIPTTSYPVTVQGTTPPVTLGTKLPTRMPLSSGAGGTFYVDGTNGNDSNAGTQAAPWKTINHALATVPLKGSIIKLLPGTYASSGTSYVIHWTRQGDVTDPVTLEAATPGTVTIENATPNTDQFTLGAWIVGATGLRIQDLIFHVTHVKGSTCTGDVQIENSNRIELYRNTFYEVGCIAITTRGGSLTSGITADDIWVISNLFRSSPGQSQFGQVTGTGVTPDKYFGTKGSHWIYGGQFGQDPTDGNWNYQNGGRRLVVANNVFTGSTAGRDIELGPENRDSFVVNNTFYGNHIYQLLGTGYPSQDASAEYAGQGLVFFANTSNTAFETGNNIVANNLFVDLDGHAASGSGPAEDGNLVTRNLSFDLRNGSGFDGTTSVDYLTDHGTGALFSTLDNLGDADPMFTNAAAYDFTLKAGSPAVAQANPDYALPYDFAGNPRKSTPDLGAFEQ